MVWSGTRVSIRSISEKYIASIRGFGKMEERPARFPAENRPREIYMVLRYGFQYDWFSDGLPVQRVCQYNGGKAPLYPYRY